MSVTVTIHSKSDCPFCEQARAFLGVHGIPFTETKHDDVAERNAMYDRLGLVAKDRTVPQVIINDGEQDYLVGGARALAISGIQSLFGGHRVVLTPVAASARVTETADMVVAAEGHSCCE
jgi:glutaredoxin 3